MSEENLGEISAMLCPKCREPLKQVIFSEVPIEECTRCLGIWLDAGELELIARREYAQESWLSKLWKFIKGGPKKGDPVKAADVPPVSEP